MSKSRKIAVLLGGHSAEREVSLSSGNGVARALREEGFVVTQIDPQTSDLAAQLNQAKPDAVFNALHGRWGEDGCVQGVLELLQIPYTHSGVLASARAMHKQRAKDVFGAAGLPLAKSILLSIAAKQPQKHLMKPPYVVKPVNEGSSVGVFIIREGDNRPPAASSARDEWTLSDEMMVEEFVPGRELTVAVMGGGPAPVRALGVTEIVTALLEFYDYEAKYARPAARATSCPRRIPDAVARARRWRFALKAHVAPRLPRRHAAAIFAMTKERRAAHPARNQHPARHDADLAGARTGCAPCE